MKPPTKMTPERLRLMANRRKMRGDPATAFVLRDLASAWEADLARIEAQDHMIESQNELNHNLVSRIEALERERDHYRSNVDRWAEEIATRDARIEELEKVVREVASAGVSFTDVRLWYDEVQMPKETLVEARRLTAGEKRYPADAGCTRHVGEPCPCQKCAALAVGGKP